MRRLIGWVTVVAGALLAAGSAGAQETISGQITGVVLDGSGTPVANVRVEALQRGELLDTQVSEDNGRFAFDRATIVGATTIRATLLGFRPVSVPVLDETRRYVIQIGMPIASLEGLVVSSEREVCRLDDNRDARALWEATRARYAPARDLEERGVASYVSAAVSVGNADPTASLDLPGQALARHGSSSLLRFSWRRRVERDGYAYRIRRSDSDRAYDSWAYAPLDADFAPHFVDESFGELHKFVLVESESSGSALTFCPRDDRNPGILGKLQIGAEGALQSAEWVFRTPDPIEDAGGRAVFMDAEVAGDEPFLLPLESMSWRRLPPGEFYKRQQRFEQWIVVPGDSVPFLPQRNGTPQGAPPTR